MKLLRFSLRVFLCPIPCARKPRNSVFQRQNTVAHPDRCCCFFLPVRFFLSITQKEFVQQTFLFAKMWHFSLTFPSLNGHFDVLIFSAHGKIFRFSPPQINVAYHSCPDFMIKVINCHKAFELCASFVSHPQIWSTTHLPCSFMCCLHRVKFKISSSSALPPSMNNRIFYQRHGLSKSKFFLHLK